MTDSLPILVLVPVGALLLGVLAGWFLRGARNSPDTTPADWRLRLASRDRELREAQQRLAALTVASPPTEDGSNAADRLAAVEEDLEKADEELDRLRALEIDKNPASGSMARRLEELEVELATLESMKCPDPGAHRRARAEQA